jgi:phage/plasmid primase-like uncharacterized protein
MSAPDAALSDAGIPCHQPVQADGRLHRFKTEGDHDANSWYVFHQGSGFVCGAFGCWKRQFTQKYSDIEFSQLTAEQKQVARSTWQAAAEKVRQDTERAQAEARQSCARLLGECGEVPLDHPYLASKQVKPLGAVREAVAEHVRGWLALPLQDERGVIHSLQFIAGDGTKRFHYGGRVQGCYFEIPGKEGAPLLICEGYATGATLAMATGWQVVCAMNCGNLLLVSQAIRRLNPGRTLVLCADNDQFTEGNPGLEKARAAAKAVRAAVACPEFSDEVLSDQPTDFNDLAAIAGISAVRQQVNRVFSIIATPIGDFVRPPENDPTELLKHRYLCERGSLLLTGPTGVGKSSFNMQALALWSVGLPFFDIQPSRPLTAILIQAENDEGDMAEMRDGICTGLNFNDVQRRDFFERVKVHTSTGVTGKSFCEEVVRPLLDMNAPNLLCIDPALSFLGANSKEQMDVGTFLRQYLNPQLYAHNCSCLMVHHTNKPRSKEDNAPTNGEWAYQGAGSAEWANWPRAVLSLQSSGEPGVYKLHAGKRGARLGWKNDQDSILYERIIVHSKEKGVICWHDGDDSDMPDRGRPSKYDPLEVVDLLKEHSLCTRDWQEQAANELGMSRPQFYRMKSELEKTDLVIKEKASGRWARVMKP